MELLVATTKAISKDKVEGLWFALPEVPRFIASTSVGNLSFFALDSVLNEIANNRITNELPKFIIANQETFCFATAYIVEIALQHLLNAILVYGWSTISTRERYFSTLGMTYSTYITSLVGSTLSHTLLLKYGVPKNFAFIVTLLGFGVFNYYALSIKVSNKNENANGKCAVDMKAKKQRRAATLPQKIRGGDGDHRGWRRSVWGKLAISTSNFEAQRDPILGLIKSTDGRVSVY